MEKQNADLTTAKRAEEFAAQLLAKIISAKLYVWKEETIPRSKTSIVAETYEFLESLENAKGNLVSYKGEEFDLSIELYGQTDTYGAYGFAESLMCNIINELEYCVYDRHYYDQMCKASDLVVDEAYKLVKVSQTKK